jgi:hypothetical protein
VQNAKTYKLHVHTAENIKLHVLNAKNIKSACAECLKHKNCMCRMLKT